MNDIDQTKIQLIKKYGPLKVALYWPEFENKDSHFFSRKNKSIPKLPVGIDDLKDLPDQYKEINVGGRFLASPFCKEWDD